MDVATSYLTQLGPCLTELKHTLSHLSLWAAKKKRKTPLTLYPGESYTVCQPKGSVLVVGSWNYPITVTLPGVVSAIAAGNCVLLKPSEGAPASSNYLKMLFDKCMDPRFYMCIEGAV
jgi:aldehyde dehydrogenase (NAD+)